MSLAANPGDVENSPNSANARIHAAAGTDFDESAANEKMLTILDTAPVSLVTLGLDGSISGWNRQAEVTYGWSRGEAIGMPSDLLVPRGDREAYSALLQYWLAPFAALPRIHEIQGLSRDGRVFPLRLTVSRSCARTGLTLFLLDLSESHGLRSELPESRERYQAIVERVENSSGALAISGARSDEAAGQARIQTILDLVPISVIEVSCDGRIADWNLEATKLYGWSRSEAVGLPSTFNVSEDDRDAYGRLLKEWLEPDDERMFEKPVKAKALHRNGRVFQVELTVLRVHGERPGLVFFVRDLTERRRLQSELQQSEQRYKAIVENIEDGYFEVEPGGKFVFLNEAFCKSFGYTMNEMLGQSYKEFYDAEAVPRIHLAFVSVWQTGVPLKAFEYLITRKDGEKRFVEDSVLLKRDRKGQPVGFLGIRRDITERKLSEKAMQASESRWRDLFDRASDFVYTCDLEGRFTSVNDVGIQLSGYSRDELIGKSTTMLLAPESLVVDSSIREDLRAGKSLASYELGILTRSGRPVTLEVSVSLLFASGKPSGVMGIARDISARRRTERFERGRASILENVARGCPLAEVLGELAVLVEKESPGSACSIVFCEKEGLHKNAAFRLAAGPSLPPDLKQGIDLSLKGKGCRETTVGRHRPAGAHVALSAGADGYSLWEPHREPAKAAGWHGCWSVPVLSRMGERLGVLAALRPHRGLPDPEERTFLVKAAELASLAIEHRDLTSQLAFQAKHDSLTSLPNRLLFEERLAQAIANGAQHRGQVAVIWLDLDGFKNINDTLGHWMGDLLLQEMAKRFLTCASAQDMLARLGGDEFAIVVSGDSEVRQAAARLAEALLRSLQLTFPICGHNLLVTASIGICVFPDDGADAATLLRRSDQAMYSAKRKAQGRFHFYSPEMGREEAEKADIETQLRAALLHGGFEVHYQPEFSLSGELMALEALLRFRHPVLGMIPPGRFIPIAENCELIMPIGEWVLREVCRQGVEWATRGYRHVRLAVNVSALQFAQTDFAETVGRVLAETGMPGGSLELELTETVVMSNVAESIRQMRQLRALGVSLAIDDFGTGYSSLNYLHRLEVDRLKIDRSFIMDLDSTVTTLPVVQAIFALARSLKQEVVAEGVETQAQLEMLREARCDLVQGFLLARPAPAWEIEKLLGVTARLPGANRDLHEGVVLQLKSLMSGLEPGTHVLG